MRYTRKILVILLVISILASSNLQSVNAGTNNETVRSSKYCDSSKYEKILVVQNGVYIKGKYYSITQFDSLLEKAYSVSNNKKDVATLCSAGVLVYAIPGIGQVLLTATGVLIIAGVTISAGTWLYKKIKKWINKKNIEKQEINEAKSKIPSRLKDKNGNVNLGLFNQNVKGSKSKKEKGGWTIDKDTAGHKGSRWKLKDKKGNRTASLDGKGKVVGK